MHPPHSLGDKAAGVVVFNIHPIIRFDTIQKTAYKKLHSITSRVAGITITILHIYPRAVVKERLEYLNGVAGAAEAQK